MSHVSVCETKPGEPFIVSLEAVKLAAQNLGLTVLEQPDYRWWGHSVGDWPIPAGWTAAELGHNAVLVLRAPADKHPNAYDVAIVPDKNNEGCYTLMYDFYDGGKGMSQIVGKEIKQGKHVKMIAPKLVQHYRMCVDALAANQVGDQIKFEEQADGSWVSYTVVDEARLFEAI